MQYVIHQRKEKKRKEKKRERFDHVILSLLEVGHQIKPSSNVV
jgi:hypothetical protein